MALIRVLVSAIPGIGGPVVELLGLIPTSMDRRSKTFLLELSERLSRIENPHVDDEAFQTQFLAAWRAATGTHIEAKIKLLASAAASCAVSDGPNHFIAMRWISAIEALELEHFAMLRTLIVLRERNGTQVLWSDVLDVAGPSLPRELFLLVLRDLQDRQLVQTTGYNAANGIDEYLSSMIWIEPAGEELALFVDLMAEEQ